MAPVFLFVFLMNHPKIALSKIKIKNFLYPANIANATFKKHILKENKFFKFDKFLKVVYNEYIKNKILC